jgi:hypothetical protein
MAAKRRLWIHRKDQWDLGCVPWVAIHWRTTNATTRLFALWSEGVCIGRWVWRWVPAHPNA